MRIVVLTDVHANLPALDAALTAIRQHGYDLLVHMGDAISIGPFPAECLDTLLALPRTRLVMGNHDTWFVLGLPTPQPAWMSHGEVQHQRWTHTQLDPALRAVVAGWPYVLAETFEHIAITFLHEQITARQEFLPIMQQPTVTDLDRAFAPYPGALIFYGHDHPFSNIQGRARYINPGSLGCAPTAEARYCLIDIAHGRWTVEHRSVPYDDRSLYNAFEDLEPQQMGRSRALRKSIADAAWTQLIEYMSNKAEEGEHQLVHYLPDGQVYAEWTLSIRKVDTMLGTEILRRR
jgi:predicted phosphodiesterase